MVIIIYNKISEKIVIFFRKLMLQFLFMNQQFNRYKLIDMKSSAVEYPLYFYKSKLEYYAHIFLD